MIYIEMIGLPGCGKTTICNQVYKSLKNEHIKIANLNDICYWTNSKIKKLIALISCITNIKLWTLFNKIYQITKLYEKKVFHYRYFWTNILIVNQIYKIKKCKKYQIILLDEGIAQLLTSIAHNQQLVISESLKIYLNKLNMYGIMPKLVSCELPIEESIKRIRLRGEKYAKRFSKIETDDELGQILLMKSSNIEFVSNLIKTELNLSTSKDVDVNVKKIINYIKQKIN